jgi:hypothetical protein
LTFLYFYFLFFSRLLERPELIFRDLESWEEDFLSMQYDHTQDISRRYPPELLNMFTASQTVLEGKPEETGSDTASASSSGNKSKGKETNATGNTKVETNAPTKEDEKLSTNNQAPSTARANVNAGAPNLTSFYEGTSDSSRSNAMSGADAGLEASPRISAADTINDTRSLERAYSQRLILLTRRSRDAVWGLPSVEVLNASEPMITAAERAIRSSLACEGLDIWFPGAGPMGHLLVEYSAEQQKQTGRFGAKVFIYRAHILGGRIRVHPSATLTSLTKANAAKGYVDDVYDDIQWLTRDESEAVLTRPLYKYLHQVMGSGAGEEFSRREKWKAMLEEKNISVNQAVGRRSFRVKNGISQRTRLLAIATRHQAKIASEGWTKSLSNDVDKKTLLQTEVDATSTRLRAQKLISLEIKEKMRPLTLAAMANLARLAKKNTTSESKA